MANDNIISQRFGLWKELKKVEQIRTKVFSRRVEEYNWNDKMICLLLV